MLVGWPIASTLGGRLLLRVGYRPLVRTGFAALMLSSIALALLLREGASLVILGATMFVMGAGMGFANTALMIAVQESATWEERGVATASTIFFRTIGGALAVGGLGGVLAAAMGPHVSSSELNQLLAPDHGAGLAHDLIVQLSQALGGGLRHVFDIIAALSVAAFGAALMFPATSMAREV
jgi:MFS family permease